MRKLVLALLAAPLLGVLAWSGTVAAETPPADSPAGRLLADEALYPPWQGGRNSDVAEKGFLFTVPEADNLADFHGDPTSPALTLFVGGNYFFAMAPLVHEFEAENPALRGKLYYETLPPGVLEQQIRNGGTITVGNMTWHAQADLFLSDLTKVGAMIQDGALVGQPVPYVTNELTIMVPAGNPGHIQGLADLGRAGLVLVMPNPRYEAIGRQIRASLVKAGGEALAAEIYDTGVANGTTILTRIHHRQTPLFLMQGVAQAGVTWTSEALFQEQIGHPISHVAIPATQNTSAVYAAGLVAGAPHPEAASLWLNFLTSDAAFKIFAGYGFKRYQP
jgi:ABC-type molybdate transport system substrate-binding protein